MNETELIQTLYYNPTTGYFWWRFRRSNRVKAGDRAGSTNGQGYREIKIDGVTYEENRLAWVYEKGTIPKGAHIDHKNRIKDDNRIENLRLASPSQNMANRSSKLKEYKGTSKHGNKWRAYVCVDYHLKYLGLHDTRELAAEVARKERVRLFGDFCPHEDQQPQLG